MKRFASLMLTAVLADGALAGCTSTPKDVYQGTKQTPAPATNTTPAQVVKLKIGQLPIIDGLPFWVADQKGFYKQMGVEVELIRFASANERDAAIMSGQIDGMLADLVASSTLAASGTPIQVASINLGATQAEGPMGILAAPNSGITKLEQLKGVEIAVSTNSVMHYVLEKLLLDADFKPEEIKITSIPQIPVRFEALMSGQVKAAILPDPLLTLAATKKATLLASDAQAKQNYSQSVVVFSKKALEEKTDGVKRFFNAYNLAVSDIKVDPNSYRPLLAEKAGLPAEIKDTYQVVPFPVSQAPKQADVESVVQWLLDKKVIKNKVEYNQLVNTSILAK